MIDFLIYFYSYMFVGMVAIFVFDSKDSKYMKWINDCPLMVIRFVIIMFWFVLVVIMIEDKYIERKKS